MGGAPGGWGADSVPIGDRPGGAALDAVANMTARYLASLTVPLRRPEEYGLAAHAATIWPAFGEAVATAVRGSQADFHLAARLMYSKWANPWVELICRDRRVRVERADPLDDGTYARRVLLDEGGDLTGAVREVLGGTRLWAGQAEVGGTGIGPSARVWCRDGDRYAAARFWFIHGDYDRAADRFFRWLWRATPGRLRRRGRFHRTPLLRWFV